MLHLEGGCRENWYEAQDQVLRPRKDKGNPSKWLTKKETGFYIWPGEEVESERVRLSRVCCYEMYIHGMRDVYSDRDYSQAFLCLIIVCLTSEKVGCEFCGHFSPQLLHTLSMPQYWLHHHWNNHSSSGVQNEIVYGSRPDPTTFLCQWGQRWKVGYARLGDTVKEIFLIFDSREELNDVLLYQYIKENKKYIHYKHQCTTAQSHVHLLVQACSNSSFQVRSDNIVV